jgi:hypothetical protein
MKAAPFFVVMLAATLSLAAQPAKKDDVVVVVPIVVGADGDDKKPCKLPATTVYVIGTNAYHCIGEKLIIHDKAPEASHVKVAAGQRVRWESKTHLFTISAIKAEGSIASGSPGNPFNGNFPDKAASEVLSGRVVDVVGNVSQRYKVTFNIVKVGLVDPDVVCSM